MTISNIVASNADTFVAWDNASNYIVYQSRGTEFVTLDTFEHYPTFSIAHAQMVAESWFNDSFGLED